MVLACNHFKKMSYQDRYLYQTSQSQGEGKQEEQQRQQREQQGKSSGNLPETEIFLPLQYGYLEETDRHYTSLWIWLKNMV